jgi:hypothetical protein
MKTIVLVVQSTYGWNGEAQTGKFCMQYGGVNTWTLTCDGTASGFAKALMNAQDNAPQKTAFEEQADKLGIPRSYGSWLVFSVIKEFEL